MAKIYHANIILGQENSTDFLFNILEKNLDFKTQGNPDFLLMEVESFGIDDARSLGKWAIGKALLGEIKVCFIKTKSITPEAQNALLKILEEPTLGTYFFINVESLGGILGTFLSRVVILNNTNNIPENIDLNNVENKNAKSFLMGNIKERLAIISSLSKKEDKGMMRDLIKNLEEVAYKDNSKNMKKILTSKIFLTSRGSSPRMLLEWLACVV